MLERLTNAVLMGTWSILVICVYVYGVFCTEFTELQVLGLPVLGLGWLALVRYFVNSRRRGHMRQSYGGLSLIATFLAGTISIVCCIATQSRPTRQSFRKLHSEHTLITSAHDGNDSDGIQLESDRVELGAIEDPAVYANLAYKHLRRGEFVEAESLYLRAIEHSGGNVDFFYELARVYDKMGRFKDAQRTFGEALALAPNLPEIHLAYGNLLVRIGDARMARYHFEKAKALFPESGPWKQHCTESIRALDLLEN